MPQVRHIPPVIARLPDFIAKLGAQLHHLMPEDEHVLPGCKRVARSRNLDLDRLHDSACLGPGHGAGVRPCLRIVLICSPSSGLSWAARPTLT
jgi:hypothetical protein